jgi:ribosomal protein S27E
VRRRDHTRLRDEGRSVADITQREAVAHQGLEDDLGAARRPPDRDVARAAPRRHIPAGRALLPWRPRMNGQYVQIRCPRCGNAAWGHPQQAVPCGACGQPLAPMPPPQIAGWGPPPGVGSVGAAPGPQPQGTPPPASYQPGAYAPAQPPQGGGVHLQAGGVKFPFHVMGKGGGVSKLKIFGGIGLALALALGGVLFKMKFGTTAEGNLSYSSLGIDRNQADPDTLIGALAHAARRWKHDAVWWSINLHHVRADGTVDLRKGSAQVVYVSPHAATSHAQSVRKDSIKKFSLGPAGVSHKDRWGFTKPMSEGFAGPPLPTCGIKDVVKILNGQGLTGNKTVRITFDPQSAQFLAWRVLGEDPKINAYFSFEDCSPIQ